MTNSNKNKHKRRAIVSSDKVLTQVVIGKSPSGYIFTNGIKVSIDNKCPGASLVNNKDEVTLKYKRFGYEIVERTKLGQKLAVMEVYCIDGKWFGYGVNARIADCVPVTIQDKDLIKSGDCVIVQLDVSLTAPAQVVEKLPDNESLFHEKLGEIMYELPADDFNERTDHEAKLLYQSNQRAVENSPHHITHQLPYITIDGKNTRDFDDAIWAKSTASGYDVSIAIADVSYYVEVDSAIDEEAQMRGNSYYRPNKVYPMLPWVLSQDLCSLKQGEPKRCVVLSISVDANGEVVSSKLHREIVQIKVGLSYSEVDQILFSQPKNLTDKADKDDLKVLQDLLSLAKVLDNKSRKQGEIFVLGDAQVMSSARIVEKIMILANELTAEMMIKRMQAYENQSTAFNAIFRAMPNPNQGDWQGIVDAVELMIGRDHGADTEIFNRQSVNALFSAFTKLPMQVPLINLLIRKLGRAEYTAKPASHYMLALNKYTHFTSPIRRYIDLCVHRFLLADVKYDNSRRLKQIIAQSNDSSFKQKELERFDVSYELLRLIHSETQAQEIKFGLFYVSDFRKRWQVSDYGKRYMSSEYSGYLLGLLDANVAPTKLREADSLKVWDDTNSKLKQADIPRLYCTMKAQLNRYTSAREEKYFKSMQKNQILLVRLLPEKPDMFRGVLLVEPPSAMILCNYDLPTNRWLVDTIK